MIDATTDINTNVSINGGAVDDVEDGWFGLVLARSVNENSTLSLQFVTSKFLVAPASEVLFGESRLVVEGTSMSTAPASKVRRMSYTTQVGFGLQGIY